MDMRDLIQDGGTTFVLCLIFGLVGLATSVAQIVMRRRRVNLVPLIFGIAAATFLIGMLGAALNLREALVGVRIETIDTRALVVSRGVGGFYTTSLTATFVTGLQVILGAAAATVRRIVVGGGSADPAIGDPS